MCPPHSWNLIAAIDIKHVYLSKVETVFDVVPDGRDGGYYIKLNLVNDHVAEGCLPWKCNSTARACVEKKNVKTTMIMMIMSTVELIWYPPRTCSICLVYHWLDYSSPGIYEPDKTPESYPIN